MKGTHRRKRLEHREPLSGERRQKTFLRYHPGASIGKRQRKFAVSKRGRFLRVTGEAVYVTA